MDKTILGKGVVLQWPYVGMNEIKENDPHLQGGLEQREELYLKTNETAASPPRLPWRSDLLFISLLESLLATPWERHFRPDAHLTQFCFCAWIWHLKPGEHPHESFLRPWARHGRPCAHIPQVLVFLLWDWHVNPARHPQWECVWHCTPLAHATQLWSFSLGRGFEPPLWHSPGLCNGGYGDKVRPLKELNFRGECNWKVSSSQILSTSAAIYSVRRDHNNTLIESTSRHCDAWILKWVEKGLLKLETLAVGHALQRRSPVKWRAYFSASNLTAFFSPPTRAEPKK